MALQQAQVSVVVIGYDDAAHVADAVRSALAQGRMVREVIAVDDCSTDGSGELLERLAEDEPRLRVLRRRSNSGGCGTPRNDGLDAVTAPYVMFLDSDDTLPPGAVDALLGAALEYDAPVASGLCVRRSCRPAGRPPGSPSCTPGARWCSNRPSACASCTTPSASTSSTAPPFCAIARSASPRAASRTRTSCSARACWPPHRVSHSSPSRCTSGTCAARRPGCPSPRPLRHRQLAGPDTGRPPVVRHPAGRRREAARAGHTDALPRPLAADVRARAGPARHGVPA